MTESESRDPVVAEQDASAPIAQVAPPLTFEQVYELCFGPVWRSVRALGVPPALVEDAVQDVFVVVHRRLAETVLRGHVKSWVLGIALRVASDYRRSQRRKGGLLPLPETLASRDSQTPFDGAAKAQALRIVEEFLSSLREEKREVFVLSELEGLRAPEIAEILDLNVNTVYSRLRVVREEFAALVSKHHANRSGDDHG